MNLLPAKVNSSLAAKYLLAFGLAWLVLAAAGGGAAYFFTRAGMERDLSRRLLGVGRQLLKSFPGSLPGGFALESAPRDFKNLGAAARPYVDAGILENAAVLSREGTVLWDLTGEAAPGFKPAQADDAVLALLKARGELALPAQARDFGQYRQSVFLAGPAGMMLRLEAAPTYLENLGRLKRLFALFGLLGLALSLAAGGLAARMVLVPVARLAAWERERESERRRADLLQEVASGIAHEVRNPLGVIRAQAEWALKKSNDPVEVKSAAGKIEAQVRGLDELVRSFLDYGRAWQAKPVRLRARGLLAEAKAALDPEAGQQNAVVVVEAGENLWISGDPDLLSRALHNLGLNALQAMPRGGQVKLSARPDGTWIWLEVSDQGPGLAEETRARLFTPFFTTRREGTGLGLALVDKVARAHGAPAQAVNHAGGGAVFRIRVPAGAAETGEKE